MNNAHLKDKISLIKPLILGNSDKNTVKKIYLFGSYAYGEPNEDSDVDLCVIIDDNAERPNYHTKLAILLYDNKIIPCDLLVFKEFEFYNSINENPKGVTGTIQKEGVLLYG